MICLGCGGMAGLDEKVAEAIGVPVVDGVAAAVSCAEAIVGLGLRTRRFATMPRPLPKAHHFMAHKPPQSGFKS